ncbi:sugar ABC transporter substrate-binding protein [Brevibacillus formosus]|uniref:ABC transporter substrate-binding protein n=1 Tax=Brevibacillus TaxID=55080 RepID=UPI000D0ED573|nr:MULTISPECIES: sugar ABC transporter substrate-binding protein [Brevibacillus]MBG9942733.1 sugar ABC transporter substrate-binding protein [Brevibacillus formosus]MBW5469100.1 extracellular solute-binding protein [Brevibacillus formosus]MED1945104.1 sugar ABC transporter substrate-binding protein [Brevibacillus formosus]MED1996209.1 sugar ABC transporter substrate-binding protein [Brevibacillus formosus]MED2081178.1 sugar ABC transporter substrate-binding protein [Brevibacillus formosus]
MKKVASKWMAAGMALLLAVVAGCSQAQPSGTDGTSSNTGTTTPASSDKKETVTLRFATWDTDQMLKIQQDIAKQFEQKNPGVKVQVEAYADGFDQKLVAAFGAKNPPDVMYMWDFPTYNASLEPLDEYVKKDPSVAIDDFYQGLLNYNRFDGKLFGLPAGFSTRVVFYNKKLFNEANVPLPTDDWTWEDFKSAAKQLTVRDKKQYGFAVRSEPDTYDLQQFVWSNGSSFISPDGKTIEGYMNSKETAEALQIFSDLTKDKSALLVGGKNQQSGNDLFKAGKLAMYDNGVWSLESYKKANVDFGTVVMPQFPGKPGKGVIATSSVSIAKDSKNKELAWEFLKFFVSSDAIKMRTSDLPVRISVVQEKKLDQDPLYAPFYKTLEQSTDTPAFLLNPHWNEINRNLSAAVNAIMMGQNAEELLNKAVNDSQKFLQK